MDPRRFQVFLSVFYPFAIGLAVSGMLAFILLVAGTDAVLTSMITVWFYFACSASLCLMFGEALKKLGFSRFFWGVTGLLFILGVALTAIVACSAQYL